MNEGRLKATVFRTLDLLGVLRLWEYMSVGVPILAYHGVTRRHCPENAPLANRRRLHVPEARFEEHLRLLTDRWTPVPLSAVLAGFQSLPRRAAVVTFDDAYRNVLTVALPILRRFNVPATVFVITGDTGGRLWRDRLDAALESTSLDALDDWGQPLALRSTADKERAAHFLAQQLASLGPARAPRLEELLGQLGGDTKGPDDDRDLLTWDEIRLLREGGLEIGSHATVHEPLTSTPLDQVGHSLRASHEQLKVEVGPGAYPFAYPFGRWTSEIRAAVENAGYCAAVTTDPGLNTPHTDAFLLKRLLVGADDDGPRLRASLSGLRAVWGTGRRPVYPW